MKQRLKRVTALILALSMALSLLCTNAWAAEVTETDGNAVSVETPAGKTLAADSGTCGKNLTWTLDDGVLTISGSGDMDYWSWDDEVPWYDNNEDIKTIVVETGVTSIGNYAFDGYFSLTEVTIPASVTSIGKSAFCSCISLTEVTIPASVTSIGDWAFCGCESLTEVAIPDGVTSIGEYAFYNCYSLSSVTIPDSVTRIDACAFKGCDNLTIYGYTGSVAEACAEECGVDFISLGISAGSETDGNATETDGNASETDGNATETDGNATETDGNATAGSGVCGEDLTWVLENGVLTISGTGDMYDWEDYDEVPWHSMRKAIKSVVFENGVTSIGSNAFTWCAITEIDIPSSVTSIGKGAFSGCEKLNSIVIPDSVTNIGDAAFIYCEGLTDAVIGNGVTSIPNDMFASCANLTSVELGDRVTSIGGWAFGQCFSLTDIKIPESVTRIGSYAFCDCVNLISVVIPDTVTRIGGYAFGYVDDGFEKMDGFTIYGYTGSAADTYATKNGMTFVSLGTSTGDVNGAERCGENLFWVLNGNTLTISGTGDMDDWSWDDEAPWYDNYEDIETVVIETGVTSIGSCAFVNCNNLTNVTIPNSVISIGDSAFEYCKLTRVDIPDSVTSIGESAFYCCTQLTRVNLGKGLISIGGSAFQQCYSLSDVTIPDGVTRIGECAFYNCYSLSSVNIPDSVTRIGDEAFSGCSSLSSVTIPDGVTRIGVSTFESCNSLSSVNIPDSVTSIGAYAFSYCESLTDVTIPDSVTSIGDSAFEGCDSLTEVTIPASVTSIGDYAFDGCGNLVIYGYAGTAAEVYADENGIAFVDLTASTEIPLSECTITLAADSYTYDGKAKTPAVTVKYGNTTLTENTDYTVAYSNNINAGTATVTVTGKGSYTGEATKTFTIAKAANTITASNFTKNASTSAQTFSIGAKATGGTLSYESDNSKITVDGTGTVTIAANYAGSAVITITAGGNNYQTATKTITVTVNAIPLSKCTITLSSTNYTYDGKAKTPAVTVKDGDVKLTKDTHYAVAYKNNTNAGTATVTVTGKGCYSGTATKTFTINKAANTITASNFTKNASTSAQTFSIGAKATGGTLSYKSNNSKITVNSAGKVTIAKNYTGKATITITAGNSNYKTVTKSITVTVNPIANTITASNFTKSYSTKKQSFSIGAKRKGSGKITYSSSSKSVTVSSAGKVTVKAKYMGKATITIKVAANGIYKATTKKITVTVNPTKTTLSSVSNAKGKKLTVKWKKNTVGTGYEIQYSTDKSFKKSVTKKTVTKNKTTSATYTGLTKGKTYYVRIRTYKTVSGTKYYSGWSSVKSVKISK